MTRSTPLRLPHPDRLTLAVSSDPARAAEAWKGVLGVAQVAVEGGAVHLLVDDSDEVLPRLFEAAVANGVRIVSVTIEGPDPEAAPQDHRPRGVSRPRRRA